MLVRMVGTRRRRKINSEESEQDIRGNHVKRGGYMLNKQRRELGSIYKKAKKLAKSESYAKRIEYLKEKLIRKIDEEPDENRLLCYKAICAETINSDRASSILSFCAIVMSALALIVTFWAGVGMIELAELKPRLLMGSALIIVIIILLYLLFFQYSYVPKFREIQVVLEDIEKT